MAKKPIICLNPPPFEPGAKAVGNFFSYWEPGSTLRIHFLSGEEQWKREVAEIASEWTQYANLDFRFYFDPTAPPVDRGGNNMADIAVDFWDTGGGQSNYGTDSRAEARQGRPSMMLPKFNEKGTILHEFGHALGLVHEHMNPVAGIRWNKEQVYAELRDLAGWPREQVDFNIFAQASEDWTQYTQFDPQSIMIYEIPSWWTQDGFSTERQGNLSQTDKTFISQVYPVTGGIQATEVIGQSGWDGWIAVDGDTIYLAKDGNLYRGQIAANTIVNQIGTGGWDGTIAVADGQIYLARGGRLFRGRLDTDNVLTEEIGVGGWEGRIAVSGDQIYVASRGNLRQGRIEGDRAILEQTIGRGGWDGPIAVWQGQVYLAAFGNLRRGRVADEVITELAGSGGWNGSISIDNGMIYHANGELTRGVIR